MLLGSNRHRSWHFFLVHERRWTQWCALVRDSLLRHLLLKPIWFICTTYLLTICMTLSFSWVVIRAKICCPWLYTINLNHRSPNLFKFRGNKVLCTSTKIPNISKKNTFSNLWASRILFTDNLSWWLWIYELDSTFLAYHQLNADGIETRDSMLLGLTVIDPVMVIWSIKHVKRSGVHS